MNINDRMHGFTVTNMREIKEIGGRLVEMEHDATGAKLVWADNGDENKLFSVGFRTLPEDNTGVFHILEHSVLCGSAKFPVREPFVELLKTSMNTFLNAMTYSDKTLYPVSSRVEQDYLNLMEVYLDAVFRPNILSDPNIFYQEGWHIDTAGDKPVYKGVVFNEMKGAMSDVDQLAERTMGKLLFPDNCYGYNSGGDPDAITDLTYESFRERYRRFYHPSNAYFYLDGDIPLDKTLSMIEAYLKEYDRLDTIPEFEDQAPVRNESTIRFPAGSSDDDPLICFGRVIGSWKDRDEMLALSVIIEQLSDSNESPLKRAVLSSGLAEDMEIYISDGIAQPYLMMIFRGISGDPGDAATRLSAIVEDNVRKIAGEGFAKKDLEASVNQMDFRFRQYPEPQALYRANAVFTSWLYGGDPAMYLLTDEAIAKVRTMIDKGEMQQLALDCLADTSTFSRLTLIPDIELGAKDEADEAARVKAAVDAMSDEEKAALEELNRGLIKWQQTDDSPEALATIPQLNPADVSPDPMLVPTEEKTAGGVRVLFHPIQCNGIVYINAYFPLTQLDLSELPAAALITEFFKDLPTENYSVLALQNEIRMHVGSISFGLDILADDKDNKSCTPCIRARASVLEEKLPYAEDLIKEILTRTRFDDISLMRELLKQIDEDSKRSAISQGHRLALYEARSHWSARDAAAEAVNGYTWLQYMHGMSSASDDEIIAFASFAKDVIAESINRQNVVMSVTATEYTDLSHLAGLLPEGKKMPEKTVYSASLPERMGIEVPSAVSFAVTAYDMTSDGHRMSGPMAVGANIISLAHLWNSIRVQGGSYGASMAAARTGNLLCYTYRDPSPARSLDIYRTIPDFLDAFSSAGESVIDGFIISTVAQTEPLLSPAAKGRSGDDFVLSGYSDEERAAIRRGILNTKAGDLAGLRDALADMAEKSTVCVVGPRSALEACPDLQIFSI